VNDEKGEGKIVGEEERNIESVGYPRMGTLKRKHEGF
jgi:hypothetical protein